MQTGDSGFGLLAIPSAKSPINGHHHDPSSASDFNHRNNRDNKAFQADLPSQKLDRIRYDTFPLRDKIFTLTSVITYMQISRIAVVYHIANIVVVFVSVINFIVSSAPQYQANPEQFPQFLTIEIICVSFFTADYFLKFTLTRRLRWLWMLDFFPMVDLISILPFYIEQAVSNRNIGFLAIFRIVRFGKLFQLMRLSVYTKQIPIILDAIKKASFPILAGFGAAIVIMILVASALFFGETLTGCSFDEAERLFVYPDGAAAKFQGIPESMWWAIVTMTTVGYGDFFPITHLGKAIAAITAFTGILVLALPLAIVGTSYSDESKFDEHETKILEMHESQKVSSHGQGTWYKEGELFQEVIRDMQSLERRARMARTEIAKMRNQLDMFECKIMPLFEQLKYEAEDEYANNLIDVWNLTKNFVDSAPGVKEVG